MEGIWHAAWVRITLARRTADSGANVAGMGIVQKSRVIVMVVVWRQGQLQRKQRG